MPDPLYIRYHKWTRMDSKRLFQSVREWFKMSSLQFYMPFFSLYFHIHNTPRSHHTIDLERRYYLHEVTRITKERYYHSNLHLQGRVYDSSKHIYLAKEIFCKTIPLIDPMHCIHNNYNLRHSRHPCVPSGYNYNTFQKINDLNNTAYVDVFCSFLFGQLTYHRKNPSFPLFYGSVNGIGPYKYDISEDYHDLRMEKCFTENLGKTFTMDMYVGDSESESRSSRSSRSRSSRSSRSRSSRSSRSRSSGSSLDLIASSDFKSIEYQESLEVNRSVSSNVSSVSSSSSYDEDHIAILSQIPLQCLFIEQLDATLEDYLHAEEFQEDVLLSGMFQISFALAYLQKHYKFTHNDLHINNVMYQETTSLYLYYKLNNRYFRVPTYGKIFKMIDFGRAIVTFRNKTYYNDVFSRNSEAGGQYSYPHQVSFLDPAVDRNYTQRCQPNPHFDLCRLSMTILEELPKDSVTPETHDFLHSLCIGSQGQSFCEMTDDFHLYIAIAKDACHALPQETLSQDIFKRYRIRKKQFPKKIYYTL